MSTRWEGKQEPISDDESGSRQNLSDRITFEKKNYSRVSVGKTEPEDKEMVTRENEIAERHKQDEDKEKKKPEGRRLSPKLVELVYF